MLSRNSFTAAVETVLFQTDVPDLVLAKDPFDSHYLCSLVDEHEATHFYLAIEITSGRLAALRTGSIDLRTALLEPERLPYFTARFKADEPNPTLDFEALVEDIDPEWLPNPGFRLSNFSSASTEDVVAESMRLTRPR